MDIKSKLLMVVVLVLSSSANAALLERLGGLAYYDDIADLTWLADANAAGITMNWADANNWATSLNVAGVTGWRLPTTPSILSEYCSGPCDNSEMGNMFFNVLGETISSSIFSNLQSNIYWSSSYFTTTHPNAWVFNFNGPDQYTTNKVEEYPCCTSNYFAWAVHSGDVNAVPVPAAAWLFGSGFIGLIGIARQKKS
jgi:hypothetical protein